jgi:hypothetical protein
MRIVTTVSAFLAAISWSVASEAADFDGTKPFVCALLELSSCAVGSDCQRETPESADIPRFVFVDVKQSTISGTRPGGNTLMTKIERTRTLGDQLVLEGAENGLSWTVTVEQTTGQMNLGAVGDGVGFVIFGSCVRASPN